MKAETTPTFVTVGSNCVRNGSRNEPLPEYVFNLKCKHVINDFMAILPLYDNSDL